jgi:hypothetical protein
MPVSDEAAILQLNTWKQNRSQLRLSLLVQAVSLTVLGTSEVVERASLEDGKISVGIGPLEIAFLSDDATFEIGPPLAAPSGTVPTAGLARCLTITLRNPLPRFSVAMPDASLMFCELP